MDSPLLGSNSYSFCVSSASSLASATLVSTTLCMLELRLVSFFSLGIALNDWKNSVWIFVLIQKELDKGLFAGKGSLVESEDERD